LLRLDSGFYSKDVLSYIEQKVIDYIVTVRFYIPIQKIISLEQNWLPLDDGIEICDTLYQSPDWNAPRRMVVVRQKIDKRPKAGGRMLSLFEGMPQYYNYRYTAYITNMKLPHAEIWRLYRQRANSENRIKELKEDLVLTVSILQNFGAQKPL
jgi:IS4 transposase